MRKIPTVFLRDLAEPDRLTRDVHPDCWWVINGEGDATYKYDGTCMLLGDKGRWWARRQVKPGRNPPNFWIEVEADEITGKRFGWEPIEQSGWMKLWREALDDPAIRAEDRTPGTYELIGELVNGNPENITGHRLVSHKNAPVLPGTPRDYDKLREWLADFSGEGVVFHHPDGRMAKIKRRDVMDA